MHLFSSTPQSPNVDQKRTERLGAESIYTRNLTLKSWSRFEKTFLKIFHVFRLLKISRNSKRMLRFARIPLVYYEKTTWLRSNPNFKSSSSLQPEILSLSQGHFLPTASKNRKTDTLPNTVSIPGRHLW
jgi:hypothetical protein